MRLSDIFEARKPPRKSTRQWFYTPDGWKGVGDQGTEVRDVIIGRNEGDNHITIGTDMELDPDKVIFREKIKNLRHKAYTIIDKLKDEPDGIDRMCKHWRVTPDELQDFYRRKGKYQKTFSVSAEMDKLIATGMEQPRDLVKAVAAMIRDQGKEPNLSSLRATATQRRTAAGLPPTMSPITPEIKQQIVMMRSQNMTSLEVAAKLRLSEPTVRSHWNQYLKNKQSEAA